MFRYLVLGTILGVVGWFAWKEDEPVGANGQPIPDGGKQLYGCEYAMSKLPPALKTHIETVIASGDLTAIQNVISELQNGVATGKLDPAIGGQVIACVSTAYEMLKNGTASVPMGSGSLPGGFGS